ncbi:hypothetical protein shim_22110 [Shimia sp. SK013]|uniref:hypothetical protein n=1 Tax=Shimia sp. SK013 TaxID=1389006 RepID=UPI0006B48127|nr:hypothetical protein [Shimia sp. SK013]KPA21504.1 hypothetical protein shim_22110 [Shimia sp. SK013]
MKPFLLSLILSLVGVSVSAFGASDGDGGVWGAGSDSGCGWACGDGGASWVPESIEDQANALWEEFEKLSRKELLNQQILGTLCQNNDCGDLAEEQASRLLTRAVEFARDQAINSERREVKWLTRMGAVFTAAGLLIAWLAYRQSIEADRRSVRNQMEISHLKGGEKPHNPREKAL